MLGKFVADVHRPKVFTVKVVISNRDGAGDPEGDTIYRDLVSKSGFTQVMGIRSGKFLKVSVEALDATSAKKLVSKMCDELRIYNPAAHSITVEV
jgi:phosphoribosylformylglycinamidine synthase PurS subunit